MYIPIACAGIRFSNRSSQKSESSAPAPVAAAWSRCRLFESTGSAKELREEALRLYEILLSGRYPMTREAYTAFIEDAVRWSGRARPADLDPLSTTDEQAAVKSELQQ